MSHRALRSAIRATEIVVGRRRLAQFARLVTNEARLDTGNIMDCNGEQIVQRLVRTTSAPIVFDVGAHYGEWSTSLLSQPGQPPTVHAFEPSAVSVERARRTLNGSATVHQVALSEKPGKAELKIVHPGAGANSLVDFTDRSRASGETESVDVSTVDIMIGHLGLDRLTLLKIDAEGHDLAVIRGARGMTGRQAVDLIQFEYNLRWIDSRTFLLDAFEELQPRGYQLGKITAKGVEVYPKWHHELETFTEGNYLAWLPEWTPRLPSVAWWGG